MLTGDLVTTPLPEVLRQLGQGSASGCLHLDGGPGETAKVYLREGRVYSVQVPGPRPQLGARLVSSGSLGPEALAEALEAQRTELQDWPLGELLVHLGYVDQPIVDAFAQEQVREQTTDLMRWPHGSWRFHVKERTREDVGPPSSVEELLGQVAERQAQGGQFTDVQHGPRAVPQLATSGHTDPELSLDPDAWSLLCKVDGVRTVTDLARACGFTLFEAGHVVCSLVQSGLLEIDGVLQEPPQSTAGSHGSTGSLRSPLRAAFSTTTAAVLCTPLGPTTDEALFAAPKPRTRMTSELRPVIPSDLEKPAAQRAAHLASASDHGAEIVNLAEVRRENALRDEQLEATRAAAQRSRARLAFAELSATAATAAPASDVLVAPAPAPAPELESETSQEQAQGDLVSPSRSPDTDMAALFRELSSLGMADDPTAAPPSERAPVPMPIKAADAKKKKGLFNR